jgi:hypothetical protein
VPAPARPTATQTSPESGCDSWLDIVYKQIGIGCPNDKLTVVRGQSDTGTGSVLAELDPKTGVERSLWACGECWSPVRFRGGIAIATPAGISFVDGSGAHSLIAATNIVRILGAKRDAKDLLVVVVSAPDDRRSIALADVARNEVRQEVDVPAGEGLPPLMPDQIREDGAVIEAHSEAGRAPVIRQGKSAKHSVSPALDRRQDLFFRFDPIWLPKGKVGYVKRKA